MANNYGGNRTSFNDYLKQNKVYNNREINPFYSDSADYNTNSKSYYDYLSRINKLIEVLAKRIWEYDEELSKRFDEWDKNLEELPEDLENLLIKWMEDGTLEKIINDNIFNKLNDKIDKINTKLDKLFINVDEFNGSDCEKIQQAMNLSKLLGGGIVYAPSRTYILECEISIYKNTTLLSENGAIFERHHKGYMFLNGDRGARYSRYDGQGNIAFINGKFDGRGQIDLGGKGSNIAIAHADNVLFDNVEITNANSHHIELNSSKNVVIRNSKFLGQPKELTFVEAVQLDLSTEGGFGAFGEYDNTPCKNVTIEGNYFGKTDELPPVSRCIGTHSTRIGVLFSDVKILNNEFDGCRDFAIQLLCYKESIIRDNIFRNCIGGVIIYSSNPDNPSHALDKYNNPINPDSDTGVQPCSYITVDNNHFLSMNGKQILYCYGREKSRNYHITFSNNTIRNSIDNSGNIMAIYTTDYKAINNTIENVSNFAIYLRQVTNGSVIGNFIKNNGNYNGIRATEKIRNLNVSNNQLTDIGGNAINVYDNIRNVTINANVIDGCNGIKEDYDAIYCHSDGVGISVSNNVFTTKTNFVYESAIYITQTVKDGMMIGNVSKKGTNTDNYRAANITDGGNVTYG